MFKIPALSLSLIFLASPILAQSPVELLKSFYETVDGDAPLSAIAAAYAEDFIDHDRSPTAPKALSDKEVIVGLFSELRSGFSDMTHKLDIVDPVGDNSAMVYWTFSGTHDGTFFAIPPSGKVITLNGVDIMKFKDGKVVEQWHVEELMSMFQQIGAAQ